MVGKNCNFTLPIFPEAVIVTVWQQKGIKDGKDFDHIRKTSKAIFDVKVFKASTYLPKRVSSCLPVSLRSLRSSKMFVKESMSACSLSKGWLVVFKFVKVEMARLTAGLIIEK